MKTWILGAALLAGTFGVLPQAQAAPLQPAQVSLLPGGVRWGVGVGVSGGGGPSYVEPAGYYRTEYRWVPATVLAGYDRFGRAVYTTTYVQQAYTVWVPTHRHYAPVRYARPAWGVGVGFWR